MTLSEHINNYTDYQPWPDESEVNEAIELLAGMTIEEFSKQNILQGDVEALALADDSFVRHCANLVPILCQSSTSLLTNTSNLTSMLII